MSAGLRGRLRRRLRRRDESKRSAGGAPLRRHADLRGVQAMHHGHRERMTRAVRVAALAALLAACGGGGPPAGGGSVEPDDAEARERAAEARLRERQTGMCEGLCPRMTECALADARA